jgi:hypothetical protein
MLNPDPPKVKANRQAVMNLLSSYIFDKTTMVSNSLLKSSVADQGSSAVLTPWIRDPGWVKNQDPDPGLNIPEHIFGSLETILWVKILKFFDADADPDSGIFLTLDPGSGTDKLQIRDKHPGSATLLKSLFILMETMV